MGQAIKAKPQEKSSGRAWRAPVLPSVGSAFSAPQSLLSRSSMAVWVYLFGRAEKGRRMNENVSVGVHAVIDA